MQPTLHEFSIYAVKMRLTENNAIGYPLALCEPLGADFDGDTVSIILVPEKAKEDTIRKLSPRYNKIYKKNLSNVFVFNHESLNGLANLSEYTPDDPDDLENPKHFYTSYTELLKDVNVEGKIKYGTPIVFTGKIGDQEYKSKVTTYGRLRISKIIGADIDEIKVDGNSIFPSQFARINAGVASKLTSYLYGQEDGVDKARQLRQVALKCGAKTGVVTFDYATLYADTNNETYKDMRAIADNPELTEKQKLVMLTERYAKYEKEVEESFSSDLKQELDRANRVKISSIASINMPQFIVSGVNEDTKLLKGTLLEGLSEEEYLYHAQENRSLQTIKQSGVEIKSFYIRCATKTAHLMLE